MTRFLVFALLATLAASTWFGHIEGVEGARNASHFIIWLVLFPRGCLAILTAEKKGSPNTGHWLVRAVSCALTGTTLCVLVWSGALATAAALLAAWVFLAAAAHTARQPKEA